jgi:hypothetical protein
MEKGGKRFLKFTTTGGKVHTLEYSSKGTERIVPGGKVSDRVSYDAELRRYLLGSPAGAACARTKSTSS